MYLLINENQIEPYNGEILKRYVGSKLVKVISNPTDEDLKEFGYMDLIEDEIPKYDEDTQFLSYEYQVKSGEIHKVSILNDIQVVDNVENEIDETVEEPTNNIENDTSDN